MDPSMAQAQVLIDELARNGVRAVVLCAGGRSAPLAAALFEAADLGRLELHVRVDERSAGFLALGLAKASFSPVAVVCTSGSAVANLHPAVLEAAYSGVGLLVVTADRPAELHGTGASQTIEQRGIFGNVASVADFPAAERKSGQNAVWRGLVCRAVAQAKQEEKPVQLNVAFREPLVSRYSSNLTNGAVPGSDWPEELAGRPEGRPWTGVSMAHCTRSAAVDFRLPARTLVVIGSGDLKRARAAADVAALAGWPVVAEPTARASAVEAGAMVLRCGSLLLGGGELPTGLEGIPERVQAPDAVVIVGRPTLSEDPSESLGSELPIYRIDSSLGWADPRHCAEQICEWLDSDSTLPVEGVALDWLAGWKALDDTVSAAVDKILDQEPWPTGLQVARELFDAVPADSNLFVGASNSIRDVDMAARLRGDVTVYSNRGVAGIDGNISTAIGLALQNSSSGDRNPVYALMGDLTFIYDTNGLWIGPDERRPDLTIIVHNDAGGGNFSLFEDGLAERREGYDRIFGTPHAVDVASLCAAHQVAYRKVDDAEGLRSALRPSGPGLRVIEVRAERARLRGLHMHLRAAIGQAAAAFG